MATYPVLKPYRDAIRSKHQWTIAAVPSVAWAKKVFPELKKNQAVEALWKAILDAVHVSDDPANDPVAEWARHNENFKARCAWLNAQKFDRLTYKSANGTDFSAELIPEGCWCGGGEYTKQGNYFNPNLPTEEIFTSPMKGKAEGKLVSTKPLSSQGQLIEDFWIRFEDGRAVEWDAAKGAEALGRMLTMDEGAARLGELALIPCSSPINQSGILFYETLFDENACCHVAVGAGFNDCIDGYLDKTDEECKALGINDSMIHVDFMIGTEDLCITGYKNGVAIPVFVNGEWAQEC
jgi:aminopeptidase